MSEMNSNIELDIVHAKSNKTLAHFNVTSQTTIAELKSLFYKKNSKYYPERQAYVPRIGERSMKDADNLEPVAQTGKVYFKDLGPQVGWSTVFLTEYAGPLVIYLLFYIRPSIIYGAAASTPKPFVVNLACACWCGHYAKRLLETVFVHHFSHATMPIMNIFRNSSYYWGFAALVAYFVNHPLYQMPSYGMAQIYGGLALYTFGELGNLSTHVHFSRLRPAGTKVRKIPFAGSNPFTWLFSLVSCPNYTYEALSWVGFSIMTQSLPAAMFTFCGAYQMTVWAIGKHKNYRREFSNYPRGRKSIIPFIL